MTKKLAAIWHIITCTDYFLETSFDKDRLTAALKLANRVRDGYTDLIERIETDATEAGEIHRLQALRAVIDEKLESNDGGN